MAEGAEKPAASGGALRRRSLLHRWLPKLHRWLSGPSSRKVRFQPEAAVFEFERQLLGGGGVPDGDAVALGLGPRCVNTYASPLVEKENKDEYASSGYLDIAQRTELLNEWSSRPSLKTQLERATPEIEKLQRAREETAISPRDQRYMPTNMGEALLLASRDEEEAEEARRVAASGRRISPLVGGKSRAVSTRSARSAGFGLRSPGELSSPIQKRQH